MTLILFPLQKLQLRERKGIELKGMGRNNRKKGKCHRRLTLFYLFNLTFPSKAFHNLIFYFFPTPQYSLILPPLGGGTLEEYTLL